MGVLDALIYGYRYIWNGSNVQAVRRSVVKFVGATVSDDPVNGVTVVTVGGGGGGAVPIQSGGSSTETALDDIAVTGGRNLLVGTDATLTNTYKFVTIFATEAIDWSPTGASVMAAYADSVRMHNDRPIMFLVGTDNTTVPAIGKLRFPYNGGADKVHIAVKDSVGADRSFWTYVNGDAHRIGNTSQDLHLVGFLTAEITLSQDVILAGRYVFASAPVILQAGITVNLVEKAANYQLVLNDHTIVALAGVTTITLPAAGAMSDGATKEVCNMSGGNIAVAVDSGGPNIYGVGASETLVDGETATYRYNSGAVSTTPFWVRVA